MPSENDPNNNNHEAKEKDLYTGEEKEKDKSGKMYKSKREKYNKKYMKGEKPTNEESTAATKTERSSRQKKKNKDKKEEESSHHRDNDAVPEPDQASTRMRKYMKKERFNNNDENEAAAKSPDATKTARERKPMKRLMDGITAGIGGGGGGESKTMREKGLAESKTLREVKDPGKTAREKGADSGKTTREKGDSGKTFREESKTQRERRKKKKREEEEAAAKVINYLTQETEAEKKAKEEIGPICTEVFGYGNGFPNWMLEVPRTISFEVKPPTKLPMVKVFRTMIVYDVPQELREHIDVGDIICKFNDHPVSTREEYTKLLAESLKQTEPHTIRYTFYRTLRTRKIAPEKVETEVPAGFEVLRDSFDYLFAYLTFVPKSQIGMNIKTYNGKVFVSAIDNQQAAISRKSLLVGDAILCIDDNIVSGIKMTEDALAQACSKRKFVKLLIERARSASGVRQVKLALGTEKTVEINPRMGEDILDLCNAQLKSMDGGHADCAPGKSIYRSRPPKQKKEHHVNVAPESVETPISTDVNNTTLLATTPPVPAAKPLNEYDGRGGYVQGTPAQVRQYQLQLQQQQQQTQQVQVQQQQPQFPRPNNRSR